jgi:excisionase family DNA binding protein
MPAPQGSSPTATSARGVPTKMLRTNEVAALFRVSPKTVTRWAKEGKLPYQKTLGGHRRYPEEVRQLAQRHEPSERAVE